MNLVPNPREMWRRQHKFTWLVVIKIIAISLPSQPFLDRHFGCYIFSHNSEAHFFTVVFLTHVHCMVWHTCSFLALLHMINVWSLEVHVLWTYMLHTNIILSTSVVQHTFKNYLLNLFFSYMKNDNVRRIPLHNVM